MVAKPQSAGRDWRDIDWSAHQRWVEVDGRPANIIDIGEGPPLVLVHGLSGSWQNWLETIPAFCEDHRVIAMDLPGFGESPLPRDEISIAGYGRWLDGLFAALGLDGAAVAGNSMGGFIGAETAIAFPHRVERLVLVSAAGLSIEHQRNDAVQVTLERTEAIAQNLFDWGLKRADWLLKRPKGRKLLMLFVAAHPERLAPDLVREQINGAGKPGFVPALDALTSYPIRDRLDDVGCPTLVVWGEKDMLVPIKDAHEFDRLIPDSRLIVYEDVGHVAMLEVPERFNADLRDFLAEQPGDAASRVEQAAAEA